MEGFTIIYNIPHAFAYVKHFAAERSGERYVV